MLVVNESQSTTTLRPARKAAAGLNPASRGETEKAQRERNVNRIVGIWRRWTRAQCSTTPRYNGGAALNVFDSFGLTPRRINRPSTAAARGEALNRKLKRPVTAGVPSHKSIDAKIVGALQYLGPSHRIHHLTFDHSFWKGCIMDASI